MADEFLTARIREAEFTDKLAQLTQDGWTLVAATHHDTRQVVGATISYGGWSGHAYGAGVGGGGGAGGGGFEDTYGGGSSGFVNAGQGGGGATPVGYRQPIYGETISEWVVLLRRDVAPAEDNQ